MCASVSFFLYAVLGIGHRALCMQGKYSTNPVPAPEMQPSKALSKALFTLWESMSAEGARKGLGLFTSSN